MMPIIDYLAARIAYLDLKLARAVDSEVTNLPKFADYWKNLNSVSKEKYLKQAKVLLRTTNNLRDLIYGQL